MNLLHTRAFREQYNENRLISMQIGRATAYEEEFEK